MKKSNQDVRQQVIVHIPHSSTFIPALFQKEFLIQGEELHRELLCMTDWYTDELFSYYDSVSIIHNYSRLVCDPERFLNPFEETMYQNGMGMYYTHTAKGKQMKYHPLTQKQSLKAYKTALKIYNKHHDKLRACVDEQIANYGKALIIDGHSFSSVALPYESVETANMERPDICIGVDLFFTPVELVNFAVYYFEELGFRVRINFPFTGTLVPNPHYMQKSETVKSIMIEVNRKLYMNEETGEKLDSFPVIQETIRNFLYSCALLYLY